MRLTFHIILCISVLFFPWWLSGIILCVACLAINRFYEAVVYGIVVDALYHSATGLFGFHYTATIFAVIVFIVSLFLRKQLSW